MRYAPRGLPTKREGSGFDSRAPFIAARPPEAARATSTTPPEIPLRDTILTVMARTASDEEDLVAALKDGDLSAFTSLVDRHAPPAMLRVAQGYVPSREIAEEVVQETWIALLKGIASFEGRSSCALGFSRY